MFYNPYASYHPSFHAPRPAAPSYSYPGYASYARPIPQQDPLLVQQRETAERIRRAARYLPHEMMDQGVDYPEAPTYGQGYPAGPSRYYTHPTQYAAPAAPTPRPATLADLTPQQRMHWEDAMRRRQEIEEEEELERRRRDETALDADTEDEDDDDEAFHGYNGYPASGVRRAYSTAGGQHPPHPPAFMHQRAASQGGTRPATRHHTPSPPLYNVYKARPTSRAGSYKAPSRSHTPPAPTPAQRPRSRSRSRAHTPAAPPITPQTSQRSTGSSKVRFQSSRPTTPSQAYSHNPYPQPQPQPQAQPYAQSYASSQPRSPPKSSSSKWSPRQYTSAHHEAATIIQTAYRVHRALRKVQAIHDEFAHVRMDLEYPPAVDLQLPDRGVVTIPVSEPTMGSFSGNDIDTGDFSSSKSEPKLAFSSRNYQILAYVENLNRLLTKLDGVDSYGDRHVRETRREVVKEVEREASRIEKWWKGAWRAHVEGKKPGPSTRHQDDGVDLPGRWVDANPNLAMNGVVGGMGYGQEEDMPMLAPSSSLTSRSSSLAPSAVSSTDETNTSTSPLADVTNSTLAGDKEGRLSIDEINAKADAEGMLEVEAGLKVQQETEENEVEQELVYEPSDEDMEDDAKTLVSDSEESGVPKDERDLHTNNTEMVVA